MKTTKIISDPEAFQLLADDSRRRIIFLLRAKPLTVSKIAEELDLSPQTVYHHIQKLKNAEMVEVVKEERVGHLIESYYQSTAEVFNCSIGESAAGIAVHKKLIQSTVENLNKLGFSLEYDDETAQRIVDAENKLNKTWNNEEFAEKVSKFEDVDFLSSQHIAETAKNLSLSDEEFNERLANERKVRELYLSMARPRKKKQELVSVVGGKAS
jgi:DNA-binding transcriptional ArsR family regulator